MVRLTDLQSMKHLPNRLRAVTRRPLASEGWRFALAAWLLLPNAAIAQSAATLNMLQGLAPVSILPKTPAGRDALAANLRITAAIQTGSLNQPTLLPFVGQQRQALKDAFITSGNASELADGLGSSLGAAYQAKAHYTDQKHWTDISQPVAALLTYASEAASADSNSGKYFFANGTLDGKAPASSTALAVLSTIGGVTDVFGKAYGHGAGSDGAGSVGAGSVGADPFGDPRPFQTEPTVIWIDGVDYFGKPANSSSYLRGPIQTLTSSPSFPSGHTTYGYTESVLLAILVPARYPQQIVRAAEYGNDRIILGAHYAMDVLGGRTVALYDLAHLLANDPHYVGQPKKHAAVVTDYQSEVAIARAEVTKVLEAACGAALSKCASVDTSRFRDQAADEAFYESTQTYGLPVVYPKTAAETEDTVKIAPEAGYLLTAAFPSLSLTQADAILTATEGPGGGFLDNGSAFGLYSRLDLYAAGRKAIAEVSAAGK